MNYSEMIEIIRADEVGKRIRWHERDEPDGWWPHKQGAPFNFINRIYEVIPDKPLEYWVNTYPNARIEIWRREKTARDNVEPSTVIRTAVHTREVLPEDEWQKGNKPDKPGKYEVTRQSMHTGLRVVDMKEFSDPGGWLCIPAIWVVVAWRPRPEPWEGEK